MFSLTIKGLWARKVRFLLTGLAVVLGVSFMSGTMILTDTMARTFDELLAEKNAGVDAIVQRPSAVEGAGDDLRERVDASTVGAVRGVPGVDAAYGSIQGFAELVRADGDVVEHDLGATIGTNWIDDARLNPLQIDAGRAPEAAGEAVIDRGTVDDQGWQPGDTFEVLAKSGRVEMTLVGAARFGAVKGIPGSTVIATDEATAQRMFGEPGFFDTVVVAKKGDITADKLALRLQGALADRDVEVLTGASDTAAKQADLRENLEFFNQFLLAFAYISLFVGMFLIYNTFSIVIAQRTRDLAMLRSIGARRGQVLGSVLVEAVAVALTSVAAGLGLGIAMSYGLRALLAQVGLDIPDGATVISPATIVTSVVVGVVVTLASALAPAVRASRVAPIAALRDVAIDRADLSGRRLLTGVMIVGLGVAGVAAGVAGSGSGALSTLGLGAGLTIIGVLVLGPVIARPVLRLFGGPARLVSGSVGRLATENARRNPKRTSATAAALVIGVALVGFITILAASSTAAVVDQVDRSFRADYVIDAKKWDRGGLSPDLAGELTALPEVATVSPVRVTPVAIDGATTELAGVDTAVFDELYDVKALAGSLGGVAAGAVAAHADEAAELGLTIGDTVTVTFARTGRIDLRVAAIFEEQVLGSGAAAWITDLATYEANVTDQYDRQIYLRAADAARTATARAALDTVLEAWPSAELQDQAELKATITSQINRMLNLIYALLALAVMIALIGIANTLALSVHERTRELGLLRAVGMTRRQVRTLVRWESIMIAVLGTALGLVLALAGAWSIVQALADEGVTSVLIPTTRMTVIVGLAIVAGMGAAVGPARRAAHLDVLRAIDAN